MRMFAALVMVLATGAYGQFQILDGKTTASLRGIDAVSPQVAWASGSGGTVLLTTDGGANWKHCAVPVGAEKLDFRGVQGFDASTAIVMSSGKGDLSRLYRTTDACQSWTLLVTNPEKDGFWDAIKFQDQNFGYLLGDPVHGSFYLAESHDGGKTWIQQHNRGLRADPDVQGAFAASNSSLLTKNGFLEFGSGGKGGAMTYGLNSVVICLDDCPPADLNADGSKNGWIRQSVPVGGKSESSGIFALSFRSESHTEKANGATWSRESRVIIAVGGDYLKPGGATATAAYSIDDGKHWAAATTPPSGYRSAVAYGKAAQTWITVGPSGTDLSRDDGKNWAPLKPSADDTPDADKNWNAISLPFVVGAKGKIGKLKAKF